MKVTTQTHKQTLDNIHYKCNFEGSETVQEFSEVNTTTAFSACNVTVENTSTYKNLYDMNMKIGTMLLMNINMRVKEARNLVVILSCKMARKV